MKLPSFLELYSALIATPSISADNSANDQTNKPLIDLLANWLDSLGFRVDVQSVPATRHKYNLLASIGQGAGGLLLAGHTDTVPFDEGQWQFDPFKLTEHDHKFYGLGTADMKGFFAFVLDALRHIELNKLDRPIHILATADEETTMAGARYFSASSQLRPDFAIIGEPTSLKPVRAHKGHMAKSIRIVGQSGHSSDPARGVNAIELMHEAISHLLPLRARLQERFHNPFFDIPYPTMNLSNIHGGDAVNRICACCELQMDIRPLPGLSLSALDELLHETLTPVMQRWPGRLTIEPINTPIPGYECPIHSPAVKTIEALLGERTIAVNYCTEAPFIQQLCPTIVLGPGSIEQAHQPDEYLAEAFIQPTQDLLFQVINHFCRIT